MSRPIAVGDRVRVRADALAQECAAGFGGVADGVVERIDRGLDGPLARLSGEPWVGCGRWALLAALELDPSPDVAMPDQTRLARALRLLDACEAIDRVADERGFADPTRVWYDRQTVAWVGESDGITCRAGTLVDALTHVGDKLAAERRK